MYQSFEVTARPEQGPPRLAALRTVLAARGLDGFIIPRADMYQGEYVADCDARLEWLTGFTGSAGMAIALRERAVVFSDGRYRLQLRAQVAEVFEALDSGAVSPVDWLTEALTGGGVIGFDPWLHTDGEIEAMRGALAPCGIRVVPCENLVDQVWADRPAPPAAKAIKHPIELAGRSSVEKFAEIAEKLRAEGQEAAVITSPESLCWLLNIRGDDVPHTPLVQCCGVFYASGALDLYGDPAKFADLGPDSRIRILPLDWFEEGLAGVPGPVRVDRNIAPFAVSAHLQRTSVPMVWGEDPCRLPKACKSEAEVAGMRAAHLRDGAAMCAFLAWVDREAPKGALTEIDVVEKLEEFRRATGQLRDVSFETICGAGPNGAIVHYKVTRATNRAVKPGELLLIDSGGQYQDGTTDITRTVPVGDVPDDARRPFTRVVQGMIAISRVRFPKGVAGAHLDALARAPLWMEGMDYDHGTGHGVGAYLSVHEGPQRLSRMSPVPLQPGMILSNEPGYYRDGAFGIRIENLICVRVAEAAQLADPHRAMLEFETLTYVPIDRRLLDVDLLSGDERAWIDAYHAEVARKIGGLLDAEAADWLRQATAPL